jgi:hypothetical protein
MSNKTTTYFATPESPTGSIVTADGYTVILDTEDIPAALGYTWKLRGSGYPARGSHGKSVYLHRVIAERASGDIMTSTTNPLVHHKNDDVFDDRRSNLQIATHRVHTEIHRARGPRDGRRYKGVQYMPHTHVTKPYRGYVKVRGKMMTTGYAATEEEAARAVDALVLSLELPHAYLNFPQEHS